MKEVPAAVLEEKGCCEAAALAFFFWSFRRLAFFIWSFRRLARACHSLHRSFSRSFSSSWRKLGENIFSTRAK